MKRFSPFLLISSLIFLGSCSKCYQCQTVGQVCSGSPYYNQVQTANAQAGLYILTVNNASGIPSIYTCSQ